MTQDDIIRMAQEAGIVVTGEAVWKLCEMVAAAERERTKYDGIHTCHAECQRPACVAVREAVARERAECAQICDEHWRFNGSASECADAIRARGQS